MVRQARMEDLKRMTEIYQIAREFMKMNGNPNQWKDDRPNINSVIEDIKRGDSYVIERDQKVVGTFTLLKTPDPCYDVIIGEWKNDEEYGTIHKVAGDGSCRGILEEALEFASGLFHNLRIDTHEDNHLMRHLIEKNGFEYCGIVFMEDRSERLAYQRVQHEKRSGV